MLRPLASLLLAAAMAVPATAQTVDRIRSEGEIRLGYRQDAAPLSYVDDQGVPAGYTVQVCAQLAQALGRALDLEEIEMTFVPVDTSNRFAKVADGEIDLLCGASTITMSRREFVDFSIPIFVDGTAVMLPVGAETTFSALNGASIGVRSGTTTASTPSPMSRFRVSPTAIPSRSLPQNAGSGVLPTIDQSERPVDDKLR